MGNRPVLQMKANRDENEPEIFNALVDAGYQVFRIGTPGDLLVQCWCGGWTVLEVKNPATLRKKGVKHLHTEAQRRDAERLYRPIPDVFNPDDALAVMASCRDLRHVTVPTPGR